MTDMQRKDGRPWPAGYSAKTGVPSFRSTVVLYQDERKTIQKLARKWQCTQNRIMQMAIYDYLQKYGGYVDDA